MHDLKSAWQQLASAQKTAKGVSLYSRFVNRPLGRVFAVGAFTLGMTPNAVTAVSGLATFSGVAVLILAEPAWWTGIVVATLLVLGFALDSADGQVARLSGRSSSGGEWLDHLIDSGKMVCVHGGVLIAAFRFYAVDEWWYLVPLAFQLVAVLGFSGMLLVTLLPRARQDSPPVAGEPSMLRSIGLLPMDYGILAWSFALSGWPEVFVWVYAGLLVLNVVLTGALLVKWYRQLT